MNKENNTHDETSRVSAMLTVLMGMSEEERSKAYVLANRWIWPPLLSEFKPDGWDELKYDEVHKCPVFRQMFKVIDDCVSEFSKSRQWWIDERLGTKEEHLAWWANGKKRPE